MTEYVKFNTDNWDDLNKVYRLVEYVTRPNSTGVDLVIEDVVTKEVTKRTAANHQIEFMEAKDW
jgi:hypothetical protein